MGCSPYKSPYSRNCERHSWRACGCSACACYPFEVPEATVPHHQPLPASRRRCLTSSPFSKRQWKVDRRRWYLQTKSCEQVVHHERFRGVSTAPLLSRHVPSFSSSSRGPECPSLCARGPERCSRCRRAAAGSSPR